MLGQRCVHIIESTLIKLICTVSDRTACLLYVMNLPDLELKKECIPQGACCAFVIRLADGLVSASDRLPLGKRRINHLTRGDDASDGYM